MKLLIIILTFFCLGCGGGEDPLMTNLESPTGSQTQEPPLPRALNLQGYTGEAMEPFLSRDGRFLFFNNRNSDPNPDLHYAERVDEVTFNYQGLLAGANTPSALEAVATMTTTGRFFFISTRDYATTLNTVFAGDFVDGVLSSVQPQSSLATSRLGLIIFDVGVAPDGLNLIMAEGVFSGSSVPDEANLVLAQFNGTEYRQVPSALFDAVNTAAREYAPALSADSQTLLFTRLELGSNAPQIYISRRTSPTSPFEAGQLVPGLQPFVEAGTFSPDGRLFYYHALVDGRMQLFVQDVPS